MYVVQSSRKSYKLAPRNFNRAQQDFFITFRANIALYGVFFLNIYFFIIKKGQKLDFHLTGIILNFFFLYISHAYVFLVYIHWLSESALVRFASKGPFQWKEQF